MVNIVELLEVELEIEAHLKVWKHWCVEIIEYVAELRGRTCLGIQHFLKL